MKISFLIQKKMRPSLSMLWLGCSVLLATCFGTTGLSGATLPPPTPASGDYSVQNVFSSEFHPKDDGWFLTPWSPTDPGWRYKLSPQTPLWLTKVDSSLGIHTINVDSTKNINYPNYSKSASGLPDPSQPVLGMGTSLEDTSVYALSKNHDDAQTSATLKELIDPVNGIGMNLFRLCIGTSDFSDGTSVTNDPKNNPHGWYSYQDGGPDSPFSIKHDDDLNITHVVKLAIQVAQASHRDIKFFASAWSPPAWMKDSNSLTGGKLLDSMIPAYAAYLRKFVQAYQAEGIPIYAITTNNEHYIEPSNYPSCYFNAQQETKLVEAIATEFAQNNITTKIWILDHNYLESPGARTTLTGLGDKIGEADSIAYHGYEGGPSYMTSTHGSYPTTGIQFTEGSTWGTAGMDKIAQIFRNNSSSYVSWVTMTTRTPSHIQGPYNTPGNGGGSLSPTLLIRNDGTVTGTDPNPDYYKTPEYYLYGQFMKFVQPGADCILSDGGSSTTTTNVAFKNPDGTIVIVAINQSSAEQDVRFVVDGSQFVAAIPATSVATYRFKGGLAPSTVAPVGVPVLPDPSYPVVTSATSASGMVGRAFSYQITASNNPTSFGASGLPAGLSVNTTTGVISGTPTVAAQVSVTLSVTNASGTVTQGLALTVSAAPVSKPVISSATSASGTVGRAFSYQITASNNPTSFGASGLPAGLTVNTSSGLISGTPTGAGTASVSLGASNAGGTGTATLTITVGNPPPPIPASPTGLTGFGWNGQVDLRWTPSANATGYNVLRATAANGTYTTVGSNVATAYYSDSTVASGAATYFYKVNALDAAGTSAASAPLSVTTVPSGFDAWTTGDVGTVGAAGSSSYQNGTYTVTGSGRDIQGGTDAFQFVSQPLMGDGAIEARVVSVSNTGVWSKAGVMIRESLAANSANMAVVVTPTTREGVSSQWRASTGAGTGYVQTTGLTAPYWVKLVRAGNVFTSYSSADGVNWTLQSTQTIVMASTVYAGLAVTAHNDSQLCTAAFDSVNVLPASTAWLADDLGAPTIAGFTAYSGGVLTLNGAGSDIWSTSDQFRYLYQPVSGDCDITVQVTGVENSNHDAKSGVMIRDTLAANSRQVDLLATANAGVYMQARASAGAATSDVAISRTLAPPCWLRLTRAGNTFTASTSPDGSTWTTLGATTVSMGTNVYLGVAGTSHDVNKLGTVTVDHLSVSP